MFPCFSSVSEYLNVMQRKTLSFNVTFIYAIRKRHLFVCIWYLLAYYTYFFLCNVEVGKKKTSYFYQVERISQQSANLQRSYVQMKQSESIFMCQADFSNRFRIKHVCIAYHHSLQGHSFLLLFAPLLSNFG